MIGVMGVSFKLNCTLNSMEYRGSRSGTSKSTNLPWLSLVLEDSECNQVEVSIPHEMQSGVWSLHLYKGDIVSVNVVAAAGTRSDGSGYDYLRATSVPVLVSANGDSDGDF